MAINWESYRKVGEILKILNILSWIWASIVAILGLLMLSDSVIAGILIIIFASAITPPVKRLIMDKTNRFKAWHISLSASILAMTTLVYAVPKPTAEQLAEKERQAQLEKEIELTKAKAKLLEEERLQAERQAEKLEQETQKVIPPVAPVINNPNKYNLSCKIVGVYDGDTATCLTAEKQQIKIRFDQIDAPEIGQDFGNASKKALSDLIYNQEVNLLTKEQDKYGRTVSEVFVNDKNINKEMVALGMAWAYREYMKDSEYQTLEDSARKQAIGIWSQPNPIYPSDFRRGKRGEQTENLQTKEIAQQQEKQALAQSGGQCGTKQYCKQMTSCSEAKHYLKVCGVSRLDKDGDGVPCEKLCK